MLFGYFGRTRIHAHCLKEVQIDKIQIDSRLFFDRIAKGIIPIKVLKVLALHSLTPHAIIKRRELKGLRVAADECLYKLNVWLCTSFNS